MDFVNISVVFGIICMLAWGGNNFVTALLSKKIGASKTAFLVQVFVLIPAIVGLPFFGEYSGNAAIILYGIPIAAVTVVGFIAITKSYEVGDLSVVAPVNGSWAVIAAILSFSFLGEAPTTMKILGIVVGALSVIVISFRFDSSILRAGWSILPGVQYALLFALCAALQAFMLSLFSREANWYMVNFSGRWWTAMGFLGLSVFRKEYRPGRLKLIPTWAWFVVLLDQIAYSLFNFGLAVGEPSVISVIAGMSPVVCAVLGVLIFKEKFGWQTVAGLLLAAGSIVLVTI